MIWNVLHWIDRLLFWTSLAIVLISFLPQIEDRRQARVGSDGRIRFPLGWVGYCFWVFYAIWLPPLIAHSLKRGMGGIWNDATLFFGILLGTLILFGVPATIVVSGKGLEQLYWLRPNKRIAWNDIVEINSGVKSKVVTITGADGTKIVHSSFLADRSRFLLELKNHCGDNLPADFPREPLNEA